MIKALKTVSLGLALAVSGIAAPSALAMPFSVGVTATIQNSLGSYAGDLTPGTNISANINLSTDEGDEFNAITTPSTVPGHEFTSFYEFATSGGFSWTGDLVPPSGSGFAADVMGIVVNNDLALTSAETGGVLPDGTYDWIELLGSTTVGICLIPGGCAPDEFTPADGEEWTLGIFADSSWFSDGSVIPDALPATFTAMIIGIEFDVDGNEIGFALATVDEFSSTLPQADSVSIPAPATAGLVGLFALAAARLRRRR